MANVTVGTCDTSAVTSAHVWHGSLNNLQYHNSGSFDDEDGLIGTTQLLLGKKGREIIWDTSTPHSEGSPWMSGMSAAASTILLNLYLQNWQLFICLWFRGGLAARCYPPNQTRYASQSQCTDPTYRLTSDPWNCACQCLVRFPNMNGPLSSWGS